MSLLRYAKTFFITAPYPYLPRKIQLKIQEKNLNEILSYAKNNSDYYKNIIPEDLDLSKVKPINKTDFLKNFDDIVTDKAVKFKDVKEAIVKGNNDGLKINNKYIIAMTSGSTGKPTVIVQDDNYQSISSVANYLRYMKVRHPIIMLGETGGYGIESSSIRENKNKAKIVNKMVCQVNSQDPIDSIIKQLQDIGPGVLVGYTGILRVVSNKMIEKGISIKEKQVFVSGEKCLPIDKEIIKKAFANSDVKILYGCTETGLIAGECKCGHLHISSDCVKVEAVDENNIPVGYDKLSDKVLITNLMNKVQPIIRYEVTDRIILHHGCECGNEDDWLEIEGRTNDNLRFVDKGIETQVPSISLLIAMAEINKNGLEKFRNFQIACKAEGVLEIALDYYEDIDKKKIQKEITEELNRFFSNYGINKLKYEFFDSSYFVKTRGKFKRVYMKG